MRIMASKWNILPEVTYFIIVDFIFELCYKSTDTKPMNKLGGIL